MLYFCRTETTHVKSRSFDVHNKKINDYSKWIQKRNGS